VCFMDFIDPEKGPTALIRLALYPLVLVIAFPVFAAILSQLRGADFLLMLLSLAIMSPLAYLIREARQGRPQRQGARRGAERTPLLPPDEEGE
jgi:predicted permease